MGVTDTVSVGDTDDVDESDESDGELTCGPGVTTVLADPPARTDDLLAGVAT